jgi:hypothetical protein
MSRCKQFLESLNEGPKEDWSKASKQMMDADRDIRKVMKSSDTKLFKEYESAMSTVNDILGKFDTLMK